MTLARRAAAARAIVSVSGRRVLVRGIAAAGAALLASAVGVAAHPDTGADAVDTAASWLMLPVLVTAAVGAAAVIDAFPAFGRDRADAQWLRRLRLGPLDGTGVAAVTGLSVLAAVGLVTGFCFATLVRPAGGDVVERVRLRPVDAARLDPAHRSLELRPASPVTAERLELRPIVLFRGGILDTPRVVVRSGEHELGRFELPPGGGLLRTPTGGAPVGSVVVALAPGEDAVVVLLDDAAHAVVATGTTAAVNAALAATTLVFPAAVALALAILLRRRLAPPVLHVLSLATIVLAVTTRLTPVLPAIAAHARGELAWHADVRHGALIAAAVVAGILVVAAATTPRGARST